MAKVPPSNAHSTPAALCGKSGVVRTDISSAHGHYDHDSLLPTLKALLSRIDGAAYWRHEWQ
jgi:hypothetical protein